MWSCSARLAHRRPLLLSTGYDVRNDLPAAVRGTDAALGGPLGPDPRPAAAQVDRLVEAAAVPGQPVVIMIAAGIDETRQPLPTSTAQLPALAQSVMPGLRPCLLSGPARRCRRLGDAVPPDLLALGFFAEPVRG